MPPPGSIENRIAAAVSALPMDGPPVTAAMMETWQALDDTEREALAAEPPDFWADWARVGCVSPFARELLRRNPRWLAALAQGAMGPSRPDLAEGSEMDTLMADLRRFRNRRMVEIIWHDLTRPDAYFGTVTALTDLAESCLGAALNAVHAQLADRHGIPRDGAGRPVPFVVLGMGKLGGRELNLSSDIDLIFVYGSGGESDGALPLDNDTWFTRLGRLLIQALDRNTADGFCFRVDVRLRPFGDAGPLCLPAAALEPYYSTHGRAWERYALVKARPCAGDLDFGTRILDQLRPFVYRRYLDFTALASLREVKALMEAEGRRNARDDIKKGSGGIREIEFIVQSFQLIHGGRHPRLRLPNTLEALAVLVEGGLLPAADGAFLRESYIFLRDLEHRLQMVADRQTQALPKGETEWERLAFAMNLPDTGALRARLARLREGVHERFERVLAAPQMAPADDRGSRLWRAAQEGGEALPPCLQEPSPFADPAAVWQALDRFAHSRALASRLTESGRLRFDALLPLVLNLCWEARGPAAADTLLVRFLRLLEAIAGRTNYVALLTENPLALSHLGRLLALSPWLAEELARYPSLMDEVLDPRVGDPADWPRLLREALDAAPDEEGRMDALRRFKRAEVVRIATAQLTSSIPVETVLERLSRLAELCLREALRLAEASLTARHGRPTRADGSPAAFGIVALGKLGAMEMGYGSDLDLVYLYDAPLNGETTGPAPLPNPLWFGRLGQKIIHYLSTLTGAGTLYSIDLRLRPSGQAGPLVISLQGFADYQQREAWTWEHQALTRARFVAGDVELGVRFEALRRQVLSRQRDIDPLRREVREMRARMRAAKPVPEGVFHVKHSPGGLTDLEFLVQFGILAGAWGHPELLDARGTLAALRQLAAAGILSEEEGTSLVSAWRFYRELECRLWLALREPGFRPEEGAAVEECLPQTLRPLAPGLAAHRAAVDALWGRLLENDSTSRFQPETGN